MKQFDWVDLYTEFSNKLLEYKNNRTELLKKLLTVYSNIGITFPKIEQDGIAIDIDPFTAFGLFNKQITDDNRKRIISGLKKEFTIKANVPETFWGIPVVNNLNAIFYRFKNERGPNDFANLWLFYEAAINYADSPDNVTKKAFVDAYNKVKDLKGNKWKFTIGLYWIRPNFYLSLDSRSRWFLANPNALNEKISSKINTLDEDKLPDAITYLDICRTVKDTVAEGSFDFDDLISLSYYSWRTSEDDNNEDNNPTPENHTENVRYWLYAAGRRNVYWNEFYEKGIIAVGDDFIGDLTNFKSKHEILAKMKELSGSNSTFINDVLCAWQFCNEMKPGDIILVKSGTNKIIGRGIVDSGYIRDDSREHYKNVRKVKWTHKIEQTVDLNLPIKVLTDISLDAESLKIINNCFDSESKSSYTKEDFFAEVFINDGLYDRICQALAFKKNVILQGAPGVGKTFMAERLAYSLIGEKNKDRVAIVQFHQSYAYEDFIEGFRPTCNGFELKKGVFYNFCKKAANDKNNEYYFIIDEINRGNLSKIFGELFMLLESDKRSKELNLLYSDKPFYIPENLYIIGTMNTADRSLAMLDYALRRRFAFITLNADFTTKGFTDYLQKTNNEKLNKLIDSVKILNEVISNDQTLGKDFAIGYSFFCNLTTDNIQDLLKNIVEFELIPLLQEYWYDAPDKVEKWSDILNKSIQ